MSAPIQVITRQISDQVKPGPMFRAPVGAGGAAGRGLELVEERPGFCGAPAARLLSVVWIGGVVAFERAELQWVSGHAAGQLGADVSPTIDLRGNLPGAAVDSRPGLGDPHAARFLARRLAPGL